jgi:putative spermidine/putrescine transport system substrate-binding protein
VEAIATPIPTASPAPTPTPTPSAADLLLEPARAEGQLNVIALPRDWMNYGELIRTFSLKYGITVNELTPQAGSLDELKAIRTTRVTGREAAPDVIDVGLSFAVQAKADDLLQAYKVSTWASIPDAVKDPDGYWYGDYYGVMAFEVNPQYVAELPADWPDLLKPGQEVALAGMPRNSYQGTMAVYSASLASGGSLSDIVPGLRFFQSLNNAGNLVDLTATGDTVASGKTPIALRWDYLALADRVAQAGERDIVVTVPKSGLLAGLYAQAISAYAPHPNAAKLWMEFLYSDEGQLLWLKGFGHPVRFADMLERDVIPQELLDTLPPAEVYLQAQFPTAEQLSTADKAVIASWSTYVR